MVAHYVIVFVRAYFHLRAPLIIPEAFHNNIVIMNSSMNMSMTCDLGIQSLSLSLFPLPPSVPLQFQPATSSLSAVNKADTKFLLIPCCFLLLRMWTQILIILVVYARLQLPTGVTRFLIYAAVSVHCTSSVTL